jgi:hypothetical protein
MPPSPSSPQARPLEPRHHPAGALRFWPPWRAGGSGLISRIVDGLQGPLLQVDITEIVVHEADEPDAVVDFLYAEFLPASTVEILIFFLCMQMRQRAL